MLDGGVICSTWSPWGRPLDETVVLVLSTWIYEGTGHTFAPGTELALASAARAREHLDQADDAD